MITRGGCLCGAVRFETSGRILFSVHCHCHWCRRAHGAAFVTWYGVSATDCTIAGSTLIWYASSAKSERGFCSTCGTTLFFKSATLAPGELHIALACAEEPVPKAPTAHIFFEAHVSWLEINDALPKVDRDHDSLKKYQSIDRTP